jgi:hypothetical protein
MASIQQQPPSGFMNAVGANRGTVRLRLGAFLAGSAEALARICRTASLALRALSGRTSDYDRRLRALCECDPLELSDAGQAARRQALRELREIERHSAAAKQR